LCDLPTAMTKTATTTKAKATTTKTTIAKTTVTKTKKPPTKKALHMKKMQSKKNRKAASKKNAAALKKKGVGIFAPVNLSDKLAAICGGKKMPRTEAIKKLWVYIKAKKLNNGRIITPDDKLKAVLPVAKIDMLKMAGMISKHMSK
jgi:chromatin remodeling complex protein RSC6